MNSFIGTKEASRRLNISIRRVQALIAAGRLPAEKIGNSYAIRESDLARVDGRKNGRQPKTANERTQREWNQILNKYQRPVDTRRRVVSTKQKAKKLYISKKLMEKPPAERTPEEWNAILDKIS